MTTGVEEVGVELVLEKVGYRVGSHIILFRNHRRLGLKVCFVLEATLDKHV